MRTINDFEMIVPMRYYNNEKECEKRQNMLENKDNNYIASEKHDGDWGMFIHYNKGNNLIRSRSISKVTGKYGDYTAKLPHLVEEMDKWPNNTVILAEICWDKYGTNANTVGTILRCLPTKAVERQKKEKLSAYAFDILMLNGEDLVSTPYIKRIDNLMYFFSQYNFTYLKPTAFFANDFQFYADKIISNGGEGCVIQRKDNKYEYGCRTAWHTLKLKQALPEAEYPVVGFIEPNKYYAGEMLESWNYFIEENGKKVAVTKPYYNGWKNGITIKLNDGTLTDVASGLTDDDRAWLATDEARIAMENGDLYAVVKAMSVNDLGRLRHAYLKRLRTDVK